MADKQDVPHATTNQKAHLARKDRAGRATSVPDRAVNRGHQRSTTGTEKCRFTWAAADGGPAGNELLSSGSIVR